MKRLLFFLMAIIFAIQGWTQDVQIGTGTATQGIIPVNPYYGYTYSQQIVKSTEISASGTILTGGTITKIRYYWTGTNNFNNSTQWRIYLGHTTKNSFASTTDWVPITGLTQVFDANIKQPTAAGWFTINLQIPFVYNGTDNLVIAVDENMPSYNVTGSVAYNSYTSTNCGLYKYGDSPNPDPAAPPTGLLTSNVPQVKIYFAEACGIANPENPYVLNLNSSNATISWSPGGLETQWNIQYKLTTDANWNSISSVTTKPYQLLGLVPNSTYQVKVQAECNLNMSGWSDTLSFTTPAVPTQLPFTTNFENDGDNVNWQFINGTQVNKWYVGEAKDILTGLPVDTLGSTKSLYIAGNATGDTNMYLGGSTTNVSRVYAFRDFYIPSGTAEVNLEFDWRAKGNYSTSDFLRVYLVPTTATIPAGAIPPGGLDVTAQIGNYTEGVGQHWLCQTTSWQHAKFRITATQFPLLANNTWRLLFHWRNENTSGTAQPPAAVDNISMNVISCPAPINLLASNPTVSSVDLSWVEKGTATAWNVYYKNINSSVWNLVTVTSNYYTLTGLSSSSTYQVKVQASCATDTSYMTGIVSFNTICAQISTFPWKEGFENTWNTAVVAGYGTTPGNCWLNIDGAASKTYTWKKSASIGIPAYQRTGTGSAQLYAYNQSMGDYLLTPTFTFTGNEKINFYGKGYSSTAVYPENIWVKAYNETLYGAFDSITDTVYLTNLLFINDTNRYTWKEYEIPLTNLVGDYRLVFARNNNVGYLYHIDDIEIDYQGSCPRPTVASVANIQAMQADISWTSGTPTDNSWRIFYRQVGNPNWDSVSVTTNPYTITGLVPNTEYEVEIKTNCGNGGFSDGRATTFRSACVPITSVPHYENFDSYGSGAFANWHPCWYRLSTYAPTLYPYLSGTYFSYPSSIYFYAPAQNYNIVASPKVDTITNPINTLRVKFKLRMGSLSEPGVEVGIMSNPADTSTFVQIGSIIKTTVAGVWEEKEVSFASFTGSGSYIVFKCSGTTITNYFNIDDVEISNVPQCAKPTSVTAINMLATQVDISWLNGQPTDNSWRIYYKSLASNTWDSVYATTNPFTLPNLTPSTNYEVYIKTDCWYDMSEASLYYSFKTPCTPIVASTSLPWNEGFEGITIANELPNCWLATNLSNKTYTQISNYSYNNRYAHSGNKSAYFTYGSNDAFYTPGFELIAGTTYTFSYWYITDGYPGWTSLRAGVYSGQNEVSFIQNVGAPIQNVSNTNYQQHIGIFTPSTNGVYYFGVKCQSTNDGMSLTIDDLSLDAFNCAMPDSIKLINITPTSVDMNWSAGLGNSWQVEYKKSDSTQWIKAMTTTNSYSFTGLSPQTEYDFRIASLCNGALDTSIFVIQYTTTPCNAITSLPYIENFDSYGVGIGTYPSCWVKFSQYTSLVPYIDGTSYSSPGSLYFYADDSLQTYAIFGPIDSSIPMDTLRVMFKMYYTSLNYHNLQVGVMNNPNDINTFAPIGNVQSILGASQWEDKEVSFASYSGTGRYIAFKTVAPKATYNCGFLDNVVVDYIPVCAKPTNLTVSNITTTSVDISWINGNPTNSSWWLYTKLASAANYDSVLISTASPYTITNLLPSTEYNYYMRTNCTAGVSESTLIYSFYTLCAPISTFPWYEGFESSWIPKKGVSNSPQPSCWININGGTSTSYLWRKTVATGIHYVRTGLGSAQLYGANESMGDYLVTPTFTLNGNQKIIFWAKGYSTSTNYPENIWLKAFNETTYGALDSVSDTTLFTNIAFINDTNQYTWKEYEFPLTGLVGNYRLAFARNNTVGYFFHLDDIMLDNMAACPRPTTTSVSNIQQTQADISWTSGTVTDNAWKIYYRQLGATSWDSVSTTSNPTTLYGLTPMSAYEFSVHTDCGTGAFSDGRDGIFRTACGLISNLPWSENFDTYGTGTGVMPACWVRNSTYALRPYVNTGGFSGNYLYFYAGTAGTYAMGITPEFDQNILMNSLILNFKFKSSSPINDTLYIGVMTDTTAASFVEVGKVFGPNTWNDYQVSFASYTGTGKYIGFRVNYGSTYTYAYLDNLVVTGQQCLPPTALTASSITQNAATISWTPGASETTWEVKLGATDSTTIVTTPTYTFSSLTAATQYTAYVRANCGTSNSAWVPVAFTTLVMPSNPIVSTSNVTVIIYNTATLGGTYTQLLDTVTAVGFEYKEDLSSSWINQLVSPVSSPFVYNAVGLTPSTLYKVRAYATTNAGTFYGDTVSFTTAAFNAPMVTTDSVFVYYGNTTAKLYGSIAPGTENIMARGFEYKTSAQTWSQALELSATGTTSITATATGLIPATSYNLRAYAETQSGKTYGAELNFNAISGLNDVDVNTMSVSLYPNPTSTTSTLVVKGIVGEAKVVITDVQGRTINTFSMKSINSEATKEINVNGFAKGVYYIRIQNANTISTQKLIIR